MTKKLKKNDQWALESMAEWLAHPMEYGVAPAELSVYYRKEVDWFNEREKVFLVKYLMPGGESGIGFTGPITWSFHSISLEEIKGMYQRTHKQRLVSLYAGWFLAFVLSQEDPSLTQPDAEKMRRLIEELQTVNEEETQYPVNLQFHDYMKVGEREHYIFKGDLAYHEHAPVTGALEGRDFVAVWDKKREKRIQEGALCGEPELFFHFYRDEQGEIGLGRMARSEKVEGKLPLFSWLGRLYGP